MDGADQLVDKNHTKINITYWSQSLIDLVDVLQIQSQIMKNSLLRVSRSNRNSM